MGSGAKRGDEHGAAEFIGTAVRALTCVDSCTTPLWRQRRQDPGRRVFFCRFRSLQGDSSVAGSFRMTRLVLIDAGNWPFDFLSCSKLLHSKLHLRLRLREPEAGPHAQGNPISKRVRAEHADPGRRDRDGDRARHDGREPNAQVLSVPHAHDTHVMQELDA